MAQQQRLPNKRDKVADSANPEAVMRAMLARIDALERRVGELQARVA